MARNPAARTLLDVACGTGKHLEYLRNDFDVEGVDLDEGLLAVARARLGSVPLHVGDMRTLDLDRRFDAVTCLFSAIGHVTSTSELDAAIASMAAHLEPGGVLLVEPWLEPDVWVEGRLHLLPVDEPELKIARVTVAGKEAQHRHRRLPLPRRDTRRSRDSCRADGARALHRSRAAPRVRAGGAGRGARRGGPDRARSLHRPGPRRPLLVGCPAT